MVEYEQWEWELIEMIDLPTSSLQENIQSFCSEGIFILIDLLDFTFTEIDRSLFD